MASDNDQGRRFFTTSEVASYCAVTNDGVLKWIKSGKLRAFSTPGGHYRVSAEDFRAFLEKYEIPIDETFFSGGERQRTVLVVDDEPNIRDIVQRLLKEMDSGLRIEEACDGELGRENHRRPYQPHLTLARCRVPWPRKAVRRWLEAFDGVIGGAFTVSRVALMASLLSPRGARYSTLERLRLPRSSSGEGATG